MVWQHLGSQHAQPVDHLARFVEPSHMGITSSKTPVGPWPGWGLLHRYKQLGCRLVEAMEEEVRDAHHPEVITDAVAWVEAERSLHLLDREIRLACPNTEGTPQHPRPREAGLSASARSTSVIWVPTSSPRKASANAAARAHPGRRWRLPQPAARAAALAVVRLGIVAPVEESRVADSGQGERRQ